MRFEVGEIDWKEAEKFGYEPNKKEELRVQREVYAEAESFFFSVLKGGLILVKKGGVFWIEGLVEEKYTTERKKEEGLFE